MTVASSAVMMDGVEIPAPPLRRFLPVAMRYGLSAAGPLCMSGAHFVAALIFLRMFSRAEFGLISFMLVIVPFCLSLCGAMIGAPAAIGNARPQGLSAAELATLMKANLVFAVVVSGLVFALTVVSGAPVARAFVFGAYGAAMCLRWFARSYSYATNHPVRVLLSDILYSAGLLTLLVALLLLHALTPLRGAQGLLVAALLGFAGFGRTFLRDQFRWTAIGSLRDYGQVWRDLARWSAMGVVLTELTVNAHAYLVTLLAGPAAFAPLAVGALLMRPVQLVLTAVPDRERPVMARQLVRGDRAGARRSVNQFRSVAGAVWLATVSLSAVLLLWFPHLILKKGYDPSQALLVLAFYAAITATRTLRTPESVLLQAARQFRALAGASLWSSAVSITATLLLVVTVGPVASLAGILLGEIVMASRIHALSRPVASGHD
jgi:O-antigen/teichoic acid export membrane protein